MSQSDYIHYKKTSAVLKNDTNQKQPPVLTQDAYVASKQYNLVNTIVNTKVLYNVLDMSGIQDVFGMRKNPQNCPAMAFCQNTQTRSNRIPMAEVYMTPRYHPLTIKQTKNAPWQRNGCACILNSVNTERNICKCKKAKA
jgi:hypothetical protein